MTWCRSALRAAGPRATASLSVLLAAALVGLSGAPTRSQPTAAAPKPETSWENPVFPTAVESVAAAVRLADGNPDALTKPQRTFVFFNLADGDRPATDQPGVRREVSVPLLLTWSSELEADPFTASALNEVRSGILKELAHTHRRAGHVGIPAPEGLIYGRLLGDVTQVGPMLGTPAPSDAMAGGFVRYCRYLVVPVTHISPSRLAELAERSRLDPSIDVARTLRLWKTESLRQVSLTLRHEFMHVYMNAAMGPERYRDPREVPLWFHEGLATWVSGTAESTLSDTYAGYLRTFAYLAERLGTRRLAALVGQVATGGKNVGAALSEVGLTSEDELFRAAADWLSVKTQVVSGFAVSGIGLVALSLVGKGIRGGMLVLIGLYFAFLAATGWASSTLGQDGPAMEFAGTFAMGLLAGYFLWRGWRRWRSRHAGPKEPAS